MVVGRERKFRWFLVFFRCWDKGVIVGGFGFWSLGWVLKLGGDGLGEERVSWFLISVLAFG